MSPSKAKEEGLRRVSSFTGTNCADCCWILFSALIRLLITQRLAIQNHLFDDGGGRYCRGRHDVCGARPIGEFVDRHHRAKNAGALLSDLWLACTLILESFDVHVPKGYISYFAMFFSIAVESLNLLRNKKNPLYPVSLPAGAEYSLFPFFSQIKDFAASGMQAAR